MRTKNLCAAIALALAALLPSAALAGPKQVAAENACRATFQEQHRNCQQTTNPPACVTMYQDKLGECLAQAATVAGMVTPTDPPKPKGKLTGISKAPATAVQ